MKVSIKTSQPQATVARLIAPEIVVIDDLDTFSSITVTNVSVMIGAILCDRSYQISKVTIGRNAALSKQRRLRLLDALERKITDAI